LVKRGGTWLEDVAVRGGRWKWAEGDRVSKTNSDARVSDELLNFGPVVKYGGGGVLEKLHRRKRVRRFSGILGISYRLARGSPGKTRVHCQFKPQEPSLLWKGNLPVWSVLESGRSARTKHWGKGPFEMRKELQNGNS